MRFNKSKNAVKIKLQKLQKQEPISLAYVVLRPEIDSKTGKIMKARFDYGFAGHMTRALSAGFLKSMDDLKEVIIKKWLQ